MENSPAARQNQIIQEFQGINDWESRYKAIIARGRALPEFSESLRTDDNKVRGCQSQVWLHAKPQGGHLFFTGDSDAAIVKGLVALLLEIYSGGTPSEILQTNPDFLGALQMNQNLSQTRVNGLASMIKQIKIYALAYKTIADRKSE